MKSTEEIEKALSLAEVISSNITGLRCRIDELRISLLMWSFYLALLLFVVVGIHPVLYIDVYFLYPPEFLFLFAGLYSCFIKSKQLSAAKMDKKFELEKMGSLIEILHAIMPVKNHPESEGVQMAIYRLRHKRINFH